MKIAIIGATSFIGKSIEAQLKSKHTVVVFDKSNYSYPEISYQSNFNYSSVLDTDAIVHCVAAGVQSNHSFSDEQILSINAFEPMSLLTKLEELSYKGVVLTFGSYFELGEHWSGENAISELELATNPYPSNNSYILSKSVLSHYVQKRHSTIKHVHLVLSNVYGPLERPNRLIPYIINGIKEGTKLQFGSGNQKRQFTSIRDVVKAIELILIQKRCGIFNFSSPAIASVKDVILEVIDVASTRLGRKVEYEFAEVVKRDESLKHLELDISKFEKEYGNFNFQSLQEGIQAYFE